MNRGAKIVIVAVVALFALTGIYYAFSPAKSRATAARDADSGSTESATGRISDPIAPGASVPQILTMGPASTSAPAGGASTPPDAAFAKPATGANATATGAGAPPSGGIPATGTGSTASALGTTGTGLPAAASAPNSLAPVIAPPTGSAPTTTGSPRILPPERTATGMPTAPASSTTPSINPPSSAAAPALAAKPALTPAAAAGTKYTIKAGDTLSTIAGDFYRDTRKWSVIAKANPGVDPAKLKIGQVINVPTDGAVARQATTVPERASNASRPAGTTHTVATGETLSAIAERYLGSKGAWKRLYEANKDAIGSDPAKLKVGTKLVIPAA